MPLEQALANTAAKRTRVGAWCVRRPASPPVAQPRHLPGEEPSISKTD